jgi:hypothetical protein
VERSRRIASEEIRMRDDWEGVGVPVFDWGEKDPRLEREKISAADFSRLLFFSGSIRSPRCTNWDAQSGSRSFTVSDFESVEMKWIQLFDELRCDSRTKDQIAPPFLSVPAVEPRSILYVGKATAKDGCWHESPSGSVTAQIEQGREYTKRFLNNEALHYNSGFWHFARELNGEAAKKWKPSTPNFLQHITWTNICKIGALKGNPSGFLLRKQRNLAVETLRQEIELFKPQLICFATANYAWDLIKEALGDSADTSWNQTGNEDWIWWRPATGRVSAALLIGHPQGKPKNLVKKWLNKAAELLPD